MQASDHNITTGPGEASKSAISETEDRRAAILEIAKKLFVQKGYKATTVAEIAAGANLSVGTVYKFFKDKETLYLTLVAEILNEFEQMMQRVLRDAPGNSVSKIGRCIDTSAALFVKHLPFIRVYYGEIGAAFLFASSGLKGELYQTYRRIADALMEICRTGIEEKLFVDLPPAELMRGLEGVHNAYLTALVQDPEHYSAEQIAGLTKRVFFESVLIKPGSRSDAGNP